MYAATAATRRGGSPQTTRAKVDADVMLLDGWVLDDERQMRMGYELATDTQKAMKIEEGREGDRERGKA